MTELPSINCLLSTLVKSHTLFSDSVCYLADHVDTAGAPPSTVAPILCLAVKLNDSTYCTIRDFCILLEIGCKSTSGRRQSAHPESYDEYSNSVAAHCRKARQNLVPAMENILADLTLRLVSHLSGLDMKEKFLRFMKGIPRFWSGHISLDDLIFSVRSSCRTMMTCLDCVERYARSVRDRFHDRRWITRHKGRPDLQWCLLGIIDSLDQTIDTVLTNSHRGPFFAVWGCKSR
ncbi:hypothetical protein ARMSODRAFT_1027393 [Armillaria solidipes]|uniref:Uncharacterized protein n=1 Tax=Armillaria solidipes TaxID=1076256 RepID=A0A2H3B4A4_9AGAR|nr:hypothetical protein ARMSODRAFT_1027393 [Armillaria solidipes]